MGTSVKHIEIRIAKSRDGERRRERERERGRESKGRGCMAADCLRDVVVFRPRWGSTTRLHVELFPGEVVKLTMSALDAARSLESGEGLVALNLCARGGKIEVLEKKARDRKPTFLH